MTRQSPADIRLALKAAGFSPVACIGKVPVLAEWQNRCDATPEEIAKWPGGNSGIDTKDTPGCDIDFDDADAAAGVEAAARDWFDGRGTIPVRFGRAPRRALLFRTATPFSKIIAKFVAPNGSNIRSSFWATASNSLSHGIHPDTGTRYSWHADLCPWNMKHDDLVEIDEAEAHAFLDYVTDCSRNNSDSSGIGRQRTRYPLAVPRGVAADPIEALAALDRLPTANRSTPPTAASSPNCCNGANIQTTCSSRWSTRQWPPPSAKVSRGAGRRKSSGSLRRSFPSTQHEHSAAGLRSRDRRHPGLPAGRLSRSVVARAGRRRPPHDALQPRRVLHQEHAENVPTA